MYKYNINDIIDRV